MIEVSNLVKKYGDHTAVDHLSFQIEKGKIYGFLGPNGAGKSTTMNMITGYIASTEGKVMIDGHDILEEPEAAKKCIGYLPEMPPLYFDMTVLEYMKFAADLKKIPRNQKDKQIKEVIAIFIESGFFYLAHFVLISIVVQFTNTRAQKLLHILQRNGGNVRIAVRTVL